MDINTQLQPVISSLLNNINETIVYEMRQAIVAQVQQQDFSQIIDDTKDFKLRLREGIVEQLAKTEISTLVTEVVKKQISEQIKDLNLESKSREQLSSSIDAIVSQLSNGIAAAANQQIGDEISRKVGQIDVQSLLNGLVEKKLGALVIAGKFPEGSIPHSSVDFSGLKITGNQIKGGIIEKFGSTGIDDLSTAVRLTVMDNASVFENPVWAPSVKVKGDLTVDGNLILAGDLNKESRVYTTLISDVAGAVQGNLNTELFQSYSNIIEENLRKNGIDLDRITQQGREIVRGNQIGYHIIDSNLQRLGVVKDFQTAGETLLSQTLYVTGKRVGINTLDPSSAFAVWDEEVEMIVGKRKQDTGYIGTTRHQRLVIGSNNQDNVIFNTDGSVEIENISVGNTPMSSAAVIPNYEGRTGEIVWNESPSLGGPIGWVCLGATRWAKFGKIE